MLDCWFKALDVHPLNSYAFPAWQRLTGDFAAADMAGGKFYRYNTVRDVPECVCNGEPGNGSHCWQLAGLMNDLHQILDKAAYPGKPAAILDDAGQAGLLE